MDSKSENRATHGIMGNPVKIFVLGIVALMAFGVSISSQRLNAG